MDEFCKIMLVEASGFFRGVLIALFSAFLTYQVAIHAGRRILLKKSIHDTAEIFIKEAALWIDQDDAIRDAGIMAHNMSIRRLEAYVTYIEKNYPETWRKISDEWKWYSFANAGRPLNHSHYVPGDRRRINFISSLYAMADEIRKA